MASNYSNRYIMNVVILGITMNRMNLFKGSPFFIFPTEFLSR